MDIELRRGEVYRITHKRKGTFVAYLIDIVPAWDDDPQDEVFLQMKFDVRAGTDQVGLALTPGKDAVRVSNLRPSLITHIEKVEGESWLREVEVEEEHEKPSEESLLDRLGSLFRRGGD